MTAPEPTPADVDHWQPQSAYNLLIGLNPDGTKPEPVEVEV